MTGTKQTGGRRGGKKVEQGDSLGLESVIFVLRRTLGGGSIESGLKQISKYFLDLFDCYFAGFYMLGGTDGMSAVGAMTSRFDELPLPDGVTYDLGGSGGVAGWLKDIFSSSPQTYDRKDLESFLLTATGEGIISEAAFGKILSALESLTDLRTVVFTERDISGSPFILSVLARVKEFSSAEIELAGKINGALSLAAERRVELREKEKELDRYRALVESREKAFFLLVDGKLEFFSEHLSRHLGTGADRIKGRDLEEFIDPRDREGMRKILEALSREEGTPSKLFYRVFRLRDGGREVEICLQNVTYGGTNTLRGTIKDVSESRRIERSIFSAKEVEGLSTLAGGVAHDFNNLIGAMVGYASLVRNSLPEFDERVKHLKRIEEAGERASKLSGQLLSMAGNGGQPHEVVDVKDVIDRVCKSCIMPMDHISVAKEYHADVTNVYGDQSQLYEALLYLCRNAREAMPQGGVINIETENMHITDDSAVCVGKMSAGDYVRITVKDHGIGMNAEVLQRASDPFFTTKKNEGRSGLGIPAAVDIVEAHRGRITLASREGEGTEAVIYLPVTRKESLEITGDMKYESTSSLRGLVVDDEEIVCRLASDMMNRFGYDAVAAMSGREALEIVRSQRVDFVLLDLVMPEMNGQETFHEIKKLDPDMPVIISSGYSEDKVISKLMDDGAVFFLKKPYRLNDLSIAIHEAVSSMSRDAKGKHDHGFEVSR